MPKLPSREVSARRKVIPAPKLLVCKAPPQITCQLHFGKHK